MRSSRRSLDPGITFGPYRIEAFLGEGGMGEVFRAVREPDGETVALKVLRAELASNDSYRKRFEHEARAAQEVEHPHLVTVLDEGLADGRYYLAMRFVAGESLDARSPWPLTLKEITAVTADVASGLDALHQRGLVHRDVKAANVLIDERGSASLTDFGLAKGEGWSVLTRAGAVVGTLDYLSPELIRGAGASSATDIYALGCVVYECLCGDPPFGGKSIYAAGNAILDETPENPCAGRDEASGRVGEVALMALAKARQRPPTATAFANMLSLAARSA